MKHYRQYRPRRGIALLLALVCLVLCSTLIVGWVGWAALEARALRQSQQRLQTYWLAESGINRAVSRLAADRDYAGEVWQPEPGELADGPNVHAQVTIRVTGSPDRSDARRIEIEAEYGDAGRPNRITRQVDFDLASQQVGEQ